MSGGVGPSPPQSPRERTAAGLLSIVVAQASFLVAIMFFLGAVYLTAYYDHFRLDAFSLGFGFAEVAIQSLNVVNPTVAFVCVLAVLAARYLATVPEPAAPPEDGESRERFRRALARALRAVARAHLQVVGAGLLLLLLWPWLGGFRWTAPLLLGAGLLLGQSRWTGSGGTGGRTVIPSAAGVPPAAFPSRTWSRAVPVFAAGLLVMWGLSLAVGALGEREARQAAADVVRRPAVVLLSTERLSLAGVGVEVKDFGPGNHFRYRYTGLRRLLERGGRYYLLPLGWTHGNGPVYVVKDSGDLRVELFPGTREACRGGCTKG